MASGKGQRIDSSDYSSIKSKVDMIFGTGAGTSGYGQTISSNNATIGSLITKDLWSSLRDDMVKIRRHQLGTIVGGGTTNDGSNLQIPDITTTITEDFRNQYNSFANTITVDRFKVADSQLTDSIIVNGQRSTPWNGKLTHSIDVSGATDTSGSLENLRFFFNAGGKLKLSPSRTGGASTSQNAMWTELLTNVGDVIIDHDNTTYTGTVGTGYALGWDNLTSSYQLLFNSAVQTTVYTPAINILFVLDISSDMGNTVPYNGLDIPKIEVLKDVARQLITICTQEATSANNVKVRLVTFANTATTLGSGWIGPDTAISLINTLTTQTGSNINSAIELAKTSYLDNGKLFGKNVIYVISGITDDSNIDEASWKTFLNTNKIISNSIMLTQNIPV